MNLESHAEEFMKCCLSGASKKQIVREYKKILKANDKEINEIIDHCLFKSNSLYIGLYVDYIFIFGDKTLIT